MTTADEAVAVWQVGAFGAGLFVAAALVLSAMPSSGAAQAENPEIAKRRAAQQTSFSDQQIADGFHKIAFRAELQFGRPAERIRKFDEPVRVFVTGGAPARRAEVAAIVADIRAHVDHIDLAMTADQKAANFVVTLVRKRDLARTIRSYYGPREAGQIQRKLQPQCLSGIGKDARYRIRRAEAVLPHDVDDFSFYDCGYEELLQGLGVINDDSSVPWTMFNDEVQMGFFDIYDQYLVNILYDPAVRPGMSKGEVDALLPEVLPRVRAWVAKVNPPAGAN
ncbi:MAG TPA: DUF2927 domain-containing protein [Xanthobacteraceae bacterium]|nr:DUF2927 domain-containing protein [Xanthobacteraceae bacterium]